MSRDDWRSAKAVYEQYLHLQHVNPLDEGIFQDFLICCARIGDAASATQRMHDFRSLLLREQSRGPSEATLALFKALR